MQNNLYPIDYQKFASVPQATSLSWIERRSVMPLILRLATILLAFHSHKRKACYP
ncbi:hypothetical protein HMPREF0658_2188 [Hoylesella marshii DSM 16973 = JCM 13450]|uniref:Uncharacterized protein n=1 Tax=Hoylesella marshii DSM 16973 = JCM 13450 TaxID=862515 RepID=E0NVI3_9BACT|nr:hypothetical protein HMPREF0658_2188 [Hoylesella marshii DSM 16973 = JCM 13450]